MLERGHRSICRETRPSWKQQRVKFWWGNWGTEKPSNLQRLQQLLSGEIPIESFCSSTLGWVRAFLQIEKLDSWHREELRKVIHPLESQARFFINSPKDRQVIFSFRFATSAFAVNSLLKDLVAFTCTISLTSFSGSYPGSYPGGWTSSSWNWLQPGTPNCMSEKPACRPQTVRKEASFLPCPLPWPAFATSLVREECWPSINGLWQPSVYLLPDLVFSALAGQLRDH